LVEIGLRIKHRVDRDRQDEHRENRSQREDAPELATEDVERRLHAGALATAAAARPDALRARMISSHIAVTPASTSPKAQRISTGFQERSPGVPRIVWSMRAMRYQVPGSSAPQASAKSFMPMRGKPMPMKPNAGAVSSVAMLTALAAWRSSRAS